MIKRILILLLSVIILLPILSACVSDGNGDETSSVTTSEPSTGDPQSIKDYKIICKENASAAISSLCMSIKNAANEIGMTLQPQDDFIKGGTDGNVPGKEILVGDTNRKESSEAKVGLKAGDYIIRVVGEKIVIQAGSELVMKEAVEFFINDIIKTNKGMISGNYEKLNVYKGAKAPVLKFGFENVAGEKVTSEDGSVKATLVDSKITSGYKGNGLHIKYGKYNSGMFMEPGTVASKIQGKIGFTASAQIMPYNHHMYSGRVMTFGGNNGVPFFTLTYYTLGAIIDVKTATGATYSLLYNYDMNSRVINYDYPSTGHTYTNDGVWQHMMVTVDFKNGTIKLYVNGEEKKPSTFNNEKVTPQMEVKIDFGYNLFPKQNATIKDGIGIGNEGEATKGYGGTNFHGLIDDFCLYDYVLNEKEILTEYANYGESETLSSTDDQALLDDIVKKLGDGVAILADSANIVHNKRINKADINDYTVKNIKLDGKLMLAANLCERLSGTVSGTTLTINGKTVNGSEKDGKVYFPAVEVCNAKGWKYIDKVSENGMFIMLAINSKLTAEDSAHINRLIPLCTVTENEPRINAEQTRSLVAKREDFSVRSVYNPSIVRVGKDLFTIAEANASTYIYRSQDEGKTWERRGVVKGMWYAVLFEHKGDLYILGVYMPAMAKGEISMPESGQVCYYGISRSKDGGATWTEINDKQGGIVIPGAELYNSSTPHHGSSNPVLKYNGKLYAARELFGKEAFVLMANENSDILNPKNWTRSGTYSNKAINPNESSAVVGPDGHVWVTSRSDTYKVDDVFLMRLDDNNNLVPYTGSAATSMISLPTTPSKFTCRYDEKTGYYYALTSPSVTDEYYMQRNYLALVVSKDLVNWEICEMVLSDREIYNEVVSISQHAFQYVDWIFDGDDILFSVREAAEKSHNWHESNMITFYRIENYADLVD